MFLREKKLVERIDVLGNNVTVEGVIRGELLIDEGDPYTKLGLEKSVAALKARNIFKDVTYEVEDGSESNLKKIKLRLRKNLLEKFQLVLVLELMADLLRLLLKKIITLAKVKD